MVTERRVLNHRLQSKIKSPHQHLGQPSRTRQTTADHCGQIQPGVTQQRHIGESLGAIGGGKAKTDEAPLTQIADRIR